MCLFQININPNPSIIMIFFVFDWVEIKYLQKTTFFNKKKYMQVYILDSNFAMGEFINTYLRINRIV